MGGISLIELYKYLENIRDKAGAGCWFTEAIGNIRAMEFTFSCLFTNIFDPILILTCPQ